MARLTFSFGTSETQSRRASRLRQLADFGQHQLRIAGELEGQRLRVGRIERDGTEDDLVVDGGSTYEFRDATVAETLSQVPFIPVPGLSSTSLTVGDVIVYGDNRCEFDICSINGTRIVAIARSSDVITSTRSIVVANKPIPSFRFDERNLKQAKFILSNELFDFLMLPAIADIEPVHEALGLIENCGRQVGLIAKIGQRIDGSILRGISSVCDFVIIDRSDLALCYGSHTVPSLIDQILIEAASFREKLLIASQVASAASQGISGKMSAAEVSDVWRLVKDGVGGFVLAEETAVDGNCVGALEQVSALVRSFSD